MASQQPISSTPAALGFRMPAEWAPQQALWMAWPHNRGDWPGNFAPIPHVYAQIVRHVSRVGRVELIVNDEKHEAKAHEVLTFAGVLPERAARIRFHRWATNRGWTRDSGPIFLKNKKKDLSIVDWKFNAWAKYRNFQKDDLLPSRVANLLKVNRFEPIVDGRKVVLEGGSIDVNGAGLLLTTEECLLSNVQARNPGLSKAKIEQTLGDYLGANKVIWLNKGIVGDDTHGHVDDIARFVHENVVVAAVERDKRDPNHAILAENLHRLRRVRDVRGRALEVVELPLPAPIVYGGQRVPASYANFLIFNGLVLLPVFDDARDRDALDILQGALPQHEIVPIYCGDLIWGLGAIHCMTQQQPR